jgi:hypothetical protein
MISTDRAKCDSLPFEGTIPLRGRDCTKFQPTQSQSALLECSRVEEHVGGQSEAGGSGPLMRGAAGRREDFFLGGEEGRR